MVTVETPVKDDLEESGEEQTKTDDANKDMEIKRQDVPGCNGCNNRTIK